MLVYAESFFVDISAFQLYSLAHKHVASRLVSQTGGFVVSSLTRIVLALTLLASTPLAAYPVAWGGAGGAGLDPFGHGWTVGVTSTGGTAWGIPGLGLGTLPFLGPCCATDFHIEFFGVPAGVSIDYLTPEGGPFGFNESTRFSATGDGVLWTRVAVSPTAVSFFAPAGTSLAPGEDFFVNITFDGAYGPVAFEAVWTGIPEPGTWAFMLSGLAGIAALRLRKKA
jgi:hypothetical protein